MAAAPPQSTLALARSLPGIACDLFTASKAASLGSNCQQRSVFEDKTRYLAVLRGSFLAAFGSALPLLLLGVFRFLSPAR